MGLEAEAEADTYTKSEALLLLWCDCRCDFCCQRGGGWNIVFNSLFVGCDVDTRMRKDGPFLKQAIFAQVSDVDARSDVIAGFGSVFGVGGVELSFYSATY